MNISRIVLHCLLTFLLAASSLTVLADVRLPAVIGSHMVLQQRTEVSLWGWCDPTEKVTVTVGWDTTKYVATGTSGARWKMKLKTPSAGGPYSIIIQANNKIVLDDVMIGEVWLCSGQSNMEMSVTWGLPYTDEVARATNQNIRFFYIPKTTADQPQDDVKAEWVVCSPEQMKKFSATAYFFGQTLSDQLKVPVGLIDASWGGTPAEVWTPAELVNNDHVLKQAAGSLKPADWWPVNAGATYNGMINPLLSFSIAGAIWYQGEANVNTASTYQQLLSTMIGAWRSGWQNEFPFYYVEIAPYAGYGDNSSSAFLREAQTKTLSTPKTGMIVITDLVDNINDIHPKLKKEVGQRLANYALAETYGFRNIAHKSPMYERMTIEKNSIRIFFDNAEAGLMHKGDGLAEFFIAASDQRFVPANAKIDGNTVIVWSENVKDPVAVRFGFRNAAQPNLFSKEGLPVNPFRTDEWPVSIALNKK